MKEALVSLLTRRKYPFLFVTLALLVLVVVRPCLRAGKTPAEKVSTLTQTRPFAQRPGTAGSNTDLAGTINPFIGTGAQKKLPAAYSGGETFPGADVPFGMVQWSPDTVRSTYSGYNDQDTRIRGFSLTHLSGAGCSAYGDVPFLPYAGLSPATLTIPDLTRAASTFAHPDEIAHAGYYRVHLHNGVTTELTVTQRSGAGRFTYPVGQTAAMLVNLTGSLHPATSAQATIGQDTISGWASSGDFCWARHTSNHYRVYFLAQFS